MSKQTPPPKLAHSIFKWYCRPERHEELHGDLEELFYDWLTERGLMKARLHYILDVIKCCQPYAWKKPSGYSSSPFTMYKNYYKTSFRILLKNLLSSFINIVGLSVAIGICMLAYAYHMPVTYMSAAIAIVILIFVLLLVVFTQVKSLGIQPG